MKCKLVAEGSRLYEKIVQLKLQASDGKYYKTDVLDTKGVLRLVQSVPLPKAEPFKMWLAEVGNDRLNEIADPEKVQGIDRRVKSMRHRERKGLRDTHQRDTPLRSVAFARKLARLRTNIELVLNMLAEVTTTALSRQEKPETFAESKMIAREGGATAKEARVTVEKRLKKSVVTSLNVSDKPALEIQAPKSEDDEE